MNVGPNAFNIAKRNLLDNVRIVCLLIIGYEGVLATAEPDGQSAVTKANVVVGIVSSESGEEVPRLAHSLEEIVRPASEIASPHTIAIFCDSIEPIARNKHIDNFITR